MSNKGKAILGLCAVLFAALVIWAVRTAPEDPTDVPPEPIKSMTYYDNTLSEERDGRTIWKLTAATITMDAETQDAEMTDIQGVFYHEDGRTVEIVAEHGQYNDGTKDVKLDGKDGVKVTTSDGAVLTCNEMEWTSAEETLAAIGDAKITRESEAMAANGDRIESRDGFRKIKIEGKAHIVKGSKEQ